MGVDLAPILGQEFIFLRLAFEGLYSGLLACGLEGNFRLFEWAQVEMVEIFLNLD